MIKTVLWENLGGAPPLKGMIFTTCNYNAELKGKSKRQEANNATVELQISLKKETDN